MSSMNMTPAPDHAHDWLSPQSSSPAGKSRTGVWIAILAPLVIIAATVVGLLFHQLPLHKEFNRQAEAFRTACAAVPSSEVTETLLAQAWFQNDNTPTLKDAEKIVEQFEDVCTTVPQETPWWVDEESITPLVKSQSKLQDLHEKLVTLEEQAYAYADFSYAALQIRYATKGSFWYVKADPSNQQGRDFYTRSVDLETAANAITVDPSSNMKTLQVATEEMRDWLASFNEYTSDAKERPLTDAHAASQPVLPTKDPAQSKGKFPVLVPDTLVDLTYSDEEIATYAPSKLQGFKMSAGSPNLSGKHPLFLYHTEGVIASVNIQEVENLPKVLAPKGKRLTLEDLPTYTGFGNEFCENNSSYFRCWVQTQDGRYWESLMTGSPSNGERINFLSGWLRTVAEGS